MTKLPKSCRAGDHVNAFLGGVGLGEKTDGRGAFPLRKS
jgi:hypothetical protein